jgi:hypothetical protein
MYALVKRYNEFGIEGLGDRRNQNPGTKPLIDDVSKHNCGKLYRRRLQTEDYGMVAKSPTGLVV